MAGFLFDKKDGTFYNFLIEQVKRSIYSLLLCL